MAHQLSRRTILRGLGVGIALPWLDAMVFRTALAAEEKPPVRMGFFYVPNGAHMPDWTPDVEGAKFQLKPTMESLAKHREKLLVLSGLTLDGARAHKDGAGDHARSAAAFLTTAHPRKTDGANIEAGVSVDQVAAEAVGKFTRFKSLELGCEQSATAGNCDSGYSCAYTSNASWRTPNTPVSKEIDPRAMFDRLFGGADGREGTIAQSRKERRRKSILDFVAEDAAALRKKLGTADQRKVDEYLYAVRDIEQRLGSTDRLQEIEKNVEDFPRPAGVPADYGEHIRLMFDLTALALQTDSTRIITFMYTNEGSNRTYPNLDVRDGHHEMSHHGKSADKQAKVAKINRFHMEQFAYLLDKLAAVKEGNGTLLDNCMLVYGSGISDGDAHNHDDLPIVVAGRGGGSLRTGRHVRFAKETPLANLYVSMLQRMNVKTAAFGDSTGKLEGL
jgi:hypothetical protein